MEPSQGVLTRTRLKAAAAAAELARLDILLSIAPCMAESRFGEEVGCLVLLSRAFYSDTQLWGAFKEHQGPKGRTRLMYAARKGNVARVRFLLDRGARMEVVDSDGFNVLMIASFVGSLEVARLLMVKGANVSAARINDGMTALMLASEQGHLEIAKLLVERGANVNAARTDDGWTALMWAAQEGHLEVVRLLLSSGADKAALNHAGGTAHSLCAAHPAIRALLA